MLQQCHFSECQCVDCPFANWYNVEYAMLNVARHAKGHYAWWHCAECHFTECHCVKCHYSKCQYARVILLNVCMPGIHFPIGVSFC